MYGIKDAIDFNKIKKVLVIKLRHHGDVLLTSPVFQVLKNHHPHLQMDALVYADTQDMLTLHPAINQVHTIDRNWKKPGPKEQFKNELGLLNKLKAEGYDLVIHLTEHWRGAIITRYIKAKYSVVGKYTRRNSWFWKSSFTHHYPTPKKRPRHTIEKHLDSLRRIGITPSQLERDLTLVPGNDAEQFRENILEDNKVNEYILIHPTSRWLFKCWESRKFASLIDNISEEIAEGGTKIILTSAPSQNELRMIEEITDNCGTEVINLSGKLNLKQLAAFIEKAKLFVGVDSVPMHMASAFNTPCVALFGPSADLGWGPRNDNCIIITSNHSCRPCGLDGCASSKISDCLNSITVEQTFDACMTLINKAKRQI